MNSLNAMSWKPAFLAVSGQLFRLNLTKPLLEILLNALIILAIIDNYSMSSTLT
jgi:hypothetical protein